MLRLRTCLSVAAVVLLAAACQERLASPADCPNLCPGNYDVRDTVLYALEDSDSTFTGYVRAGQGSSLRVSYQLPVSEDRAIVRFATRPDSFPIGSSNRTYTVDSVNLEISLLFRDTLVNDLTIYLYRLPKTVDSTTTFAQVDAAFIPGAILDSFKVTGDTITKRLVTTFKGAALSKVAIPPADSGVLAMGVQIRSATGTGIRIGSGAAGSAGPTFRSYIQVADTSDTTFARTLTPSVGFSTFVSQSAPVTDPAVLTLGGVPSSRAIIRFPWPIFLRDSATLIRATLQLVPAEPITGLPNDSAFVVGRPVLADLGGKSSTASDAVYASAAGVVAGHTDTLGLEVRRSVLLWQTENGLPPMFMLQIFPEGSTFTTAKLGSSHSAAAFRPRIRVTYTMHFPFENP